MLNKGGDQRSELKAAQNRARVAACEARGEDKRIADMVIDGRWLTMLVRLRKVTGDERYLTEDEATSYGPEPAARKAFNDALRRANTALVDDILSGRIELKISS